MSEIFGMITNGIERGWNVQEITTSLINAGYSQEEINVELKKNSSVYAGEVTKSNSEKFNSQDLKNYQTPSIVVHKSHAGIWIIVFLLIICVIAGAFLLFWK